MGRGDVPYLYNPPREYNAWDPYNGFNPKAVSQASLVRPPPRPKQDGPLIDWNRHPDSYPPQPFGRHDIEPMHKSTKKRVNRARVVQLTLRVLTLICAIGIMVCVVCLKMPKTPESLMIRIPVGIDIVISVYNTYTLGRNSKVRTPKNSASYHGFALFMDVGLVPFYVLIAIIGNAQYIMAADDKDRWTSFLDSSYATSQFIKAAWMSAAAQCVLHGFSTIIDIYLVIVFKKIVAMPPDMNPLEDDTLTRRKHKHRYKNSEVTLVDEKHMSDFMGSTATSTPNRMSRASESAHSGRDSRKISFTKSRTGEQDVYSPHNPKTAHLSRVSFHDQMYQQQGATTSRVNLHRDPDRAEDGYSTRTSPMPAAHPSMPKRSSFVSVQSTDTRSIRNSRDDLAKDNWFAESQGNDENMHPERQNPYSYGNDHSRPGHLQPYQQAQGPNHRGSRRFEEESQETHLPNGHPLHMCPPTPQNLRSSPSPPPQPIAPRSASRPMSTTKVGFSHHIATHSRADDELLEQTERSKTMTSEISMVSASSRYSDQETAVSELSSRQTESSVRTAPSRQLYGDLAAAMRGVRHQPLISPRPKSHIGSLHWASSENSYSDTSSNGTSRLGARLQGGGPGGTIVRKDRSPVSELDEAQDDDVPLGSKRYSGHGRVISRTGVDLRASHGDLAAQARRREVSGKVAEEGRAGTGSGWFGSGMFRRASGFVS